MTDPRAALALFGLSGAPEPLGFGHIHTTWLVPGEPETILQRINTHVFPDPLALMGNIVRVTDFLSGKLSQAGEDPLRGTLHPLPALSGRYAEEADGSWYRVYLFIPGTVSRDAPENPDQFEDAGGAVGRFQRNLDGFPAESLFLTIPCFHDTPKRVRDLRLAVEKDVCGRAASAQEEIVFALSREGEAGLLLHGLEDSSLPLCVTHNDTKFNNILLDVNTGRCTALIDLDTVMPGCRLYDYGDALRTGACTAPEDERDISRVRLDPELFAAFTKGYLRETLPVLNARELELLPFSARLMTYECGVRFLADYLSGDTYFHMQSPDHNLVRARAQFALVRDMEENCKKMDRIIDCILQEARP